MLKSKFVSVSVVIPCFCCSRTLENSVQTILNQTLLPSEIIMINDGSIDQGKTQKSILILKKKIKKKFQNNKCNF